MYRLIIIVICLLAMPSFAMADDADDSGSHFEAPPITHSDTPKVGNDRVRVGGRVYTRGRKPVGGGVQVQIRFGGSKERSSKGRNGGGSHK